MTARLFACLCVTMLWQVQTTAPSSSESEVLTRRVALDASNRTSLDAISILLAGARVPGGIISVSNGCPGRNTHAFPLAETTLKEGLNFIAGIDSDARWSYSDGVILVGIDRTNSTILNTIINDIEIRPQDALTLSIQKLVHSPDVQASVQRAGLEEITPELGFGQIPRNPKSVPADTRKPIRLHQTTLVHALNTLALTTGTAVWEYDQYICNGKASFRLDWTMK